MTPREPQRIFILGSGGRLGAALMKEWAPTTNASLIGLPRAILNFEAPEACLDQLKSFSLTASDILINCAAMTHVDDCEENPSLATKVNATTPGLIAELAARSSTPLLHVSTDYVFDGKLSRPYRETDSPNPISHYGASKLAGEQAVLQASPLHYVARVSWVFGPERPSFIDQLLERARTHNTVSAIADKTSSPSYTKDLARWFSCFLPSQLPGGIYHLCNTGPCTWQEYGAYALRAAARHGIELQTSAVAPLSLADMKNFIAQRPQHSALDTSKFSQLTHQALRPWQEAVEEFIALLAQPAAAS